MLMHVKEAETENRRQTAGTPEFSVPCGFGKNMVKLFPSIFRIRASGGNQVMNGKDGDGGEDGWRKWNGNREEAAKRDCSMLQ